MIIRELKMGGKLKTTSEKEWVLLATIAEAKKKIEKLQQQQKVEIGTLACKHGLNLFELAILDEGFKKLSEQLACA